jgi:mannose-6-phosphate isomerase-like protein (cupin superfamily)
MRNSALLVPALIGLFMAPAMAEEAAATILTTQDAQNALADNHAPGFAMKTLHTVDTADAHTSMATLRRDQSETTGLSHDHVTEIYKILEGEATLLTGGNFHDGGKAILSKADPAIGPSHQGIIEGGKSARVKVGDMVILAPGTPHQFSRIDGHVTYMVIRFSKEKY